MKLFICAMNTVLLGIPADQTRQIIPISRIHETESEGAFISLPNLFQLKEISAPHGIVLKTEKPLKTVLLCPKIENELEISEEKIHLLPEALGKMREYFSGAYFFNDNLILILDPVKLMENMG
ncbi:MAG: chemotaxis protein CheW [Spirochaetes bacterium]|nr:chemotaxis protein CheW [Spirochaetota bacterium]